MSLTHLDFALQDLHHGWWQATLADGTQQTTIKASAVTGEPLLRLLWAVRLLLLGANESTCIWLEEPGQHRWLFSRTENPLQIHIVRFDDSHEWSDEKGETVLRTACDLLPFAKRLFQQLGQLAYQGDNPDVPLQEYQKLKEAITAFEQEKREK